MSYALCPECGGDGTVAPDRGATGRPWCRPCLGTGLLTPTQAFERGVRRAEPKVREALERAVEKLPTAPRWSGSVRKWCDRCVHWVDAALLSRSVLHTSIESRHADPGAPMPDFDDSRTDPMAEIAAVTDRYEQYVAIARINDVTRSLVDDAPQFYVPRPVPLTLVISTD